ncbi:MAG: septation protein A [Gammaproteobacteria bacterium]|nr:septation protein A [Gammaproteobacteria bacterium]
MKALLDLIPVVAFFTTYFAFSKDFYLATIVLIIAMMVQMIYMWIKGEKIGPMYWVSIALVLLLGGITVVLKDEIFLKWKVTVANLLLASILIIGDRVAPKPILQYLMGTHMQLPKTIWHQLAWWWAGFFIFLALVNLYVVYNFSTEVWVNFKLFGVFGLLFVFAIVQSIWLNAKLPPELRDQLAQRPQTNPSSADAADNVTGSS